MKTTDFARYVSAFLTDYLPKQQGTSQNTIRSYKLHRKIQRMKRLQLICLH